MLIISAILTILLVGLSSGGILVSRRIEAHQTLFLVVGISFFLFTYVGMFVGFHLLKFISHSSISLVLGIFTLVFIGFLIRKYDPAFGYVKQEPVTLSVFLIFFFFIGLELAIFEASIWFALLFTVTFVIGLISGFLFTHQFVHQRRTPPYFALIPLVPLLFIGLFKLL